MQRPEFQDRYFNDDGWLPLDISHDQIRDAIVYAYGKYHRVNEFHIEEFGERFHDSFRAMNAIGDYIGHQFNDALIRQKDILGHNPHDDRRPDIIHEAFREAAEDRDNPLVDGLEQKAAAFKSFFTSHNESHTNLVFIQYRVNSPGEIIDDVEPIEFTQVLFARGGDYNWDFEPRGQNSNTTYRAAGDLKDALRSNPVYQNPEAICLNEHVEKYRRVQASFDPVFAENQPEYATEQVAITQDV